MDEAKLLELIENELAGDDAAEFRQRVADDPALEAWVARVRNDRDILCALEDPELPRDFLAELEPMLARPMLVDPVGGMNEFEKRHQRQRRAMKFALITRRVAMAASVVLVAGAGLWAASQFMNGNGGTNSTVADGTAQPNELLPQTSGDVTASAIDPEATVHHFAPPADVRIASNAGNRNAGAPPVDELPRGIALVIRAGEAATIETTLAAAMTPYNDRGALVRNFSYDDAVALDLQLRQNANANPADRGAPMRADASAGGDRPAYTDELHRLADRIRSQRQVNPRALSSRPADELLLGNRNRMPSYEQQLEYSSVGAAYSVAVPGDSIDDLLRFLVIDRGLDAQLIVLPQPAGIGESQEEITSDRWMHDRTTVAAWIRANANDDTASVPLAVIVIDG